MLIKAIRAYATTTEKRFGVKPAPHAWNAGTGRHNEKPHAPEDKEIMIVLIPQARQPRSAGHRIQLED